MKKNQVTLKNCKWKYPPSSPMDKECVALCEALNKIPGIHTYESCCGHGEHEYRIWFQPNSVKSLPKMLYYFDWCHSGRQGWRCVVYTDCAASHARFMIEGPIGDVAYKDAEHIAQLLEESRT